MFVCLLGGAYALVCPCQCVCVYRSLSVCDLLSDRVQEHPFNQKRRRRRHRSKLGLSSQASASRQEVQARNLCKQAGELPRMMASLHASRWMRALGCLDDWRRVYMSSQRRDVRRFSIARACSRGTKRVPNKARKKSISTLSGLQ